MKAIQVGAFEAKNRLSEFLSLAEKGQTIFITRRGKRVAMLTAAEPEGKADEPDLFDSIRSFRSAGRRGPETLRELIELGRQ